MKIPCPHSSVFRRFLPVVLVFSGFLTFLNTASAAADDYVWWEAENAVSDNFPPESESPFKKSSLDAEELSGGDWLHANRGNKGEPYTATYEIEVPADAEYTLYIRKLWHHALFTWQFDGGNGPSGEVTRQTTLIDDVELRPKVSANWIDAGQVTLKEGTHRFTFTQTGTDDPEGAGFFGIDCFALVPFAWNPSGKLRPGEKSGLQQEGFTAFEPDIDLFTDEALVDLRDFNHAQCGQLGRLIVKDGDFSWEQAPDARVKFWGQVIGSSQILASDQSHEQYVRRMAKLGVNMVRLHGSFHGGVEGDPLAISDHYLDRFDHFVATCKKHGVYFMVNTFYDKWIKGRDIGAGYEPTASPNAWQFIHPEGRQLWAQWTTRLLDRTNSYTGLRNSEDPTIAIVQLSNENNYFFHAFQPYQSIPVETMKFLEDRYAAWLKEKYGSLEKAVAAWGEQTHERDDLAEGRLGLLTVHQLTGAGQRGKDQAAFLVHDYLEVTDGFIAHLRDIGYDGVVNNGNWLSADARILEPLDKMANMNAALLSRHGVNWGAPTQLEVFYELRVGDKYASRSSLHTPWKLPLAEVHYEEHAMMVCEPKGSSPNRFRAEWLPLAACFGALNGMDAQMHFAGSLTWANTTSRDLWAIDSPVHMGQSPALSLIYREGLIAEAPVVIEEKLDRQALLDLEGAAYGLISSLNADEIQPSELQHVKLSEDDDRGINPLALMTGSLHREFVDDPAKAEFKIDERVEACIDAEAQAMRSITGELEIHWGKGLFLIKAPRAQGAVGFLKDVGPVQLPDMVVDSGNEYASVICVPLDGQPIAQSRKLLLSVVTEDQDYGYSTEPATLVPRRGKEQIEGVKITNLGSAPIQHRNPEGTVRLLRDDAAQLQVTAVDWNGYPIAQHGTADEITLRADVISYVIQKP